MLDELQHKQKAILPDRTLDSFRDRVERGHPPG